MKKVLLILFISGYSSVFAQERARKVDNNLKFINSIFFDNKINDTLKTKYLRVINIWAEKHFGSVCESQAIGLSSYSYRL